VRRVGVRLVPAAHAGALVLSELLVPRETGASVKKTPDRDDGGTAMPMSLRDWIAGRIIAALVTHQTAIPAEEFPILLETLPDMAYDLADAMLKARVK
jgi:hypothetical protein